MPMTSQQALSFLTARLGKVDPEIIRPLKEYTYTRDIPIGSDIDRTVEALILRRLETGAQGNQAMQGRSWIGRGANDLKGVNYAMDGKATRVFTGGREARWTSLDLERARAVDGVGFDTEQIEVINEVFQQEANDVGYFGDAKAGIPGFVNSDEITRVDGDGMLDGDASKLDIKKLVIYLNAQLQAAQKVADDIIMPTTLLVSPAIYGKLFSILMPDSNASSVIEYLQRRSIAFAKNGTFNIYPMRELAGSGKDGKDRSILYTPDKRYLNFNILPVWREKTYDKGLEYCAAYLWRIAEIQFRHPETIVYVDGL